MEVNKLYNESNMDTMKRMPDCHVDSIVTDPPYELGFMGKSWDNTGIAYSVELWKECLRVLKPGGHLLAFSGSRTYHRMTCAIEDAGFEIRDMVEWIYGSGFPKSLSIDKALDSMEKNTWLNISKLFDNTNKSVIFAEWKGNLKNANSVGLSSQKNGIEIGICIPKNDFVQKNVLGNTLTNNLSLNAKTAELILAEVRHFLGGNTITAPENVDINTLPSQSHVRFVERLPQSQTASSLITSIVQCVVRELQNEKITDKIKEEEVLKIWLGKTKFLNSRDINVLNVALIENLKHITLSQSKIFQNLDMISQTECVSAMTVTITESTMECLITNMVDILKKYAIDKKAGVERELVGVSNRGSGAQPNKLSNHSVGDTGIGYMDGSGKEFNITAPATDSAKQWQGWGTALKPAHEPICMARKPLGEKTVAENVLKHGTGGINIAGCRVETDPQVDDMLRIVERKEREAPLWKDGSGFKNENNKLTGVPISGRFPANLIHDGSPEVVEIFPHSTSGEMNCISQGKNYGIYGKFNPTNAVNHKSEGSAARFFYCAKTSPTERNMGCGELEEKQQDESRKDGNPGGDNPRNRGVNERKNFHPTVKPISLMRYLCKLITPPNGLIYDPFTGSGSTLIACKLEGFNYIGSELQPEYCEIAEARIKSATKEIIQPTLF